MPGHHDLDPYGTGDGSYPEGRTPLRYRRDVRRDDAAGIAAEAAHVRAHLSAVADADDDPDTRADDVTVTVTDHVDGDPALVSVIGEIEAEPNAPYLRPDYDPAADAAASDIRFTPYEDPAAGLHADWDAFARFEAGR